MPKIDIDKVPIDTATGYPPPFNKAVRWPLPQATSARRWPHTVRRQHLYAQAGCGVLAASLA